MTITRNDRGGYVISDIVRDHLVTRTYYGYPKAQAVSMFKREVKGTSK